MAHPCRRPAFAFAFASPTRRVHRLGSDTLVGATAVTYHQTSEVLVRLVLPPGHHTLTLVVGQKARVDDLGYTLSCRSHAPVSDHDASTSALRL